MTNGGQAGNGGTYAGDKTVQETWDILKAIPDAVLVDVRTDAEWTYVGIPDLSTIDKQVYPISWALFPDMRKNPNFLNDLAACQPKKDAPVLFLCRSGVRSAAAAAAATAAGYTECYNILDGFEGGLDAESHRGRTGGWKAAKLQWKQG